MMGKVLLDPFFKTSVFVLWNFFPKLKAFKLFFQLPRLYNIYKEMGIVTSFQNILDNIFLPLFEVTVDPDSHPQLHVFLKQVHLSLLRGLFIISVMGFHSQSSFMSKRILIAER